MGKIKKIVTSKLFVVLLWVFVLVVIWEYCASIVAVVKRTPENTLPSLVGIIESVISQDTINGSQTALQMVIENANATFSRAALGFAMGTVIGFVLALLMHMSKIVEKIAFPYLMLIQMVPILGMAPIIYSITGDITQSRMAIAAILTFYPVATNTLAGFHAVEKEKFELMHSYAASKFQLYTKTLIPASLPYFFTGLKIAAPMAITASILVDTLQGDLGLGCLLSQSLKGAMTRYVFWQIVFLSAFAGIMSFNVIGWIQNFITGNKKFRWKRR